MSRSIFYRVKAGPGAWQRSVVDETALPQNVTGLTNGTTYEFDLGAGVLVDVTPSGAGGLVRQAATQLLADPTDSLTYSASHTASTAAASRLLLVVFGFYPNVGAEVTGVSVSFGGQALTQINVTARTAGTPDLWAGYLLDADIPSGAQTLTVTLAETGSDQNSLCGFINVIEYSGVDQVTPIPANGINAAFGTQITQSLTMANASSLMVAAGIRKNQNDTSSNVPWTTNNGSVLVSAEVGTPTFSFSDASCCVAEYAPGATGATSMTLAPAFASGSSNMLSIGFEIKAA